IFMGAFLAVASSFLALSPVGASQSTQSAPEPTTRIECGPGRGVLLKQVKPKYPPGAKANGIQGTVRIVAIINKDGIPEKLRLLSGPPELVSASLDAIMQWRYKPYKLNGKAVPVETTITIRYMVPRARPSPRTERTAH